jgi:hypothetical protein
MTESRTYRVTVRGRFGDLSDAARTYLHRHVDDHEIFKSAYTPEGSLTYDARIDFFNLRYEVRVEGDDVVAGQRGLREAETFLATMGFAYRGLKFEVVEMSRVWNDER